MFKNNLRRLLSDQGLQQKDLAKMVGVSHQSVSAWCKGYKVPRMQMMNKIAQALGCTLAELTEPNRPSVDQEIISLLQPMSDKQKHMVLAYAKFIAKDGSDA